MKHFFYTDNIDYTSKNGTRRILRIYVIKNGIPEMVSNVCYRPGSTKGAKSEAFAALVEIGMIPKKWLNASEGASYGPGYFVGEVTKHYTIEEIY